MVRDRLKELQEKHEQFCKNDDHQTEEGKIVARYSNSEIQLDLCLHKVTQISKKIIAITNDVEHLEHLQKDIIANPLLDHKEVVQLERSSDLIFNTSAAIQKEISEYRAEVGQMQMQKSHEIVIKNHLNKLESDLTKARNDFRAAQVDYIEKTQQLHQREYDIMTGHDDDHHDDHDKTHSPLPAEFLGDYFAQAEEAKAELREIKARDKQIKKVEESVIQVNQLFKEVNSLLKEQGEKIDTIEKCVENSVDYVQEANVGLKQAKKYQSITRKHKIYCVGVLVAILAVTVLLVVIVITSQTD
ncbi:syntaxin-like [Ruditapes philippinarum]|uniref:syntaxin-like n=1 Tax=Ruditapes philippinarum TaxID=129788 RepID=UPI00295B9022|nr:syntaxin-like [Ruditapes philippinarum]XP_060569859.1 syntaxin-like [Ruditapes philippinarum]